MSIASGANEATTRSQVIDTQLAQAGWSKSRRSLVEEFVVIAKEPDRSFDGQHFADYVLLGSDGKPLLRPATTGCRQVLTRDRCVQLVQLRRRFSGGVATAMKLPSCTLVA